MFGDVIEYECIRLDHVPLRVPTGREVTIYDRCWAHCPGGADGDHDWQRVSITGRVAPSRTYTLRRRPRRAVGSVTSEAGTRETQGTR